MFVVFIIGTAGSGKSLLTASFQKWLRIGKQNVASVNLDPGVLTLPYEPDIDVRNYVNINNLMEKHHLGPNGALVMASDLIAEKVGTLGKEIEALKPDLVIIDTPGQMELFAFRASGPYIVDELTQAQKAIVYLFDSVFSFNPLNYVSNMFLSAAIYNRFFVSQIHILSKSDLLLPEDKNQIVDWSTNSQKLESVIEEKLTGTRRLLSRDMLHAIFRLGIGFSLIPVSARTNEGIINLNIALERVLAGGEKFTF